MRILIVDDESSKCNAIAQALREIPGVDSADIDIAPDVLTATRMLSENVYTLLVLDIALPTRVGEPVSAKAGANLLRDVLDRPGFNVPQHIVGLTGHDEIFDDVAREFAASVLTLLRFRYGEADWSAALQNLARHIVAADATARSHVAYAAFLGIVCALHEPEFGSILRLPWQWRPRPQVDDFVSYYEGTITAQHSEPRRVIAACVGRKGMASAAVLASKLIALFRPQYLVMTGITAGVAGRCNYGDVIAADVCWDWGSGKWSERDQAAVFSPSPYQVAINAGVRAKLNLLASDSDSLLHVEKEWPGRRPETRLSLRLGPVASGAAVLSNSTAFDAIKAQHRELIGAEMEVYGVFLAAAEGLRPAPSYFSLKSVVDFGGTDKNDDFQAYGAFTSANILRVFAERYLLS